MLGVIEGVVNSALDAVIALTVSGTAEQSRRVDVVIDTGYAGDTTLPAAMVNDLGLTHFGSTQLTLANGEQEDFDTYIASVDWTGNKRGIAVHEIESSPLIGMQLLEGHRLQVEVEHGGQVLIEPLTR